MVEGVSTERGASDEIHQRVLEGGPHAGRHLTTNLGLLGASEAAKPSLHSAGAEPGERSQSSKRRVRCRALPFLNRRRR